MDAFTWTNEEIDLIHEVRELATTKIAQRANYLDSLGDEVPDWVIPELLAKRNLFSSGYSQRNLGEESFPCACMQL